MDWLTTLVGGTRAELLRLLRGAARPINELAGALGITDNAVRTHIIALERDGMVRAAGTARSTGGKPATLYELTPAAEELFPKAYSVVLAELVRTLKDELGDETARALLRRVGSRLAPARREDAAPAERVAAAVAVLESVGGSIEVTADACGWTLRSEGCPLSAVVAEEEDACEIAAALVRAVTGMSVDEVCERGPRPRCAFRVEPARPSRRAPPISRRRP